MNKILIDTCVWLDIAKDPNQQFLLNAVDKLIRQKELIIIVPRLVLDEFVKNKNKIIKESNQSLTSVFKRVREVVDKFGDTKSKDLVLEQLNNIGNKIPSLGESTATSITRIENLLKSGTIIEATDEIKLRAVQRAIERNAPFHNQRNNINDAIIIETYAN